MPADMFRVLVISFVALTSCRSDNARKEYALSITAREKGDIRAALEHAQKAAALAPKRPKRTSTSLL